MAYNKNSWQDGDIITAEKLNHMEDGIEAAGGLTNDVKTALLQIAEKVAYIDEHGQDYYDDLYDALYPSASLVSISAVYTQSGTVYPTTSLSALKDDLVVTAYYDDTSSEAVPAADYMLSGALTVGTSVITASYNGKTATFNVTVSAVPTVTSISAVYTQSGTVYDTDSLDSLKSDLVVTATYSDSSTATVPSADYTLSGTLTEGTSTITASYGGKTTTFNVTVTHLISGWLYHFNQSLASSGTKDFGLVGTGAYDTGLFDSSCYSHIVPTSGTASSDTQYGLYANNLSDNVDFGSDFTFSCWAATQVNKYGHLIDYTYNANSSSTITNYLSSSTAVATGWGSSLSTNTKSYAGMLIQMSTSLGIVIRFANAGNTKGNRWAIAPPNSFDTTQWHHYALTRKNNDLWFFVDGVIVAKATASESSIYDAKQIAISTNWSASNTIQQMPNGEKIQDFYLAPFCKWESDFDASAITY